MIICAQCGAVPEPAPDPPDDTAPLGWTTDLDDRRGRVHICPTCTRRHARAIEGKLDAAWW